MYSISTQRTHVLPNPNHTKDGVLSLPRKFLYDLYAEGYTAVEITSQYDPVFTCVSRQLGANGIDISEYELKEKLVKYQRDNKEMLVNNHGHLLKMNVHLKENLPLAFDVHVSELENNERFANGFDINCLALFVDSEILVFFPNQKEELGICRYNSNGKMKWDIAFVFNCHRFPYQVFSTKIVHKRDRFQNPYAGPNL